MCVNLAYNTDMTMTAIGRDERLAVRLTAWQKHTIERAASVCGGSVTDFTVRTLVDRAQEVLADQPVFEVNQTAWDEFNRALMASPTGVPGMHDLLTSPTVFDR